MVAIAIFSADPVLRRSLEKLLRGDPTITVVGVADDPAAVLRLPTLTGRGRGSSMPLHGGGESMAPRWRGSEGGCAPTSYAR